MQEDKRVIKSIASFKNLVILLNEIHENPSKFTDNDELQKALHSQGGLAKYSCKERHITSSSINTLKRISSLLLDNKFDEFEKHRKNALFSLGKEEHKYQSKNLDRKKVLKNTINDLKTENILLKQDLLLLTMAFEKAIRLGRSYAEKAPIEIQATCKKEYNELLSFISRQK